MTMDWKKLLTQERLKRPDYSPQRERPIYIQDADRITFSAPFRRLANKTQVHPLYEHDHIHHRLIHSVETASVGRSLGILVGEWLEKEAAISDEERHTIAGVVQAACLAHDIGNPPFGHAGEAAIGDWFAAKFQANEGLFARIGEEKWAEFSEFEGNAQGFRLISNLEMYRGNGGMQLSYAVLSAFSKYPITANVKSKIDSKYCGAKKFGIFETELEVWKDVAAKTELIPIGSGELSHWARNPLVFLVEAADDICYNILDVEDAFTSGDLSSGAVVELLEAIAGKPNRDFEEFTVEERISYLRAKGIGTAIAACVEAFKDNYESIMQGYFNSSLVDASSVSDAFKELEQTAKDRIFKARRKTELEVSGRNVIWRVLDGVLPGLEELGKLETRWDPKKIPDYHSKLVRALNIDLRGVKDAYTALHALSDFTSGMTDRYAASAAKMVSGVR